MTEILLALIIIVGLVFAVLALAGGDRDAPPPSKEKEKNLKLRGLPPPWPPLSPSPPLPSPSAPPPSPSSSPKPRYHGVSIRQVAFVYWAARQDPGDKAKSWHAGGREWVRRGEMFQALACFKYWVYYSSKEWELECRVVEGCRKFGGVEIWRGGRVSEREVELRREYGIPRNHGVMCRGVFVQGPCR